MNKKSKAKSEMLKELSKEMSNDMYSPMEDMLKGKNLKKVSVMSDSPEGLEKGLTMAEKLMKLKSKEKGNSEEEMPEIMDEMSEEYENSEEMPEKEDMYDEMSEEEGMDVEMSEEEMRELYEMLKNKFSE